MHDSDCRTSERFFFATTRVSFPPINGTAEEWGPGGVDPAEMDAARSGSDTTREEAALRLVSRDVARSTPRARFADAVRDVLDTQGDSSGDDGEMDDGSSPRGGARAWFARSRAGGGAGAAAVDADAPRSDVAAATAWMLARLDEAAAEARRARRDETRRAETKLTNVRASHETRLRALDARHRAALDAWKRDELARARNAARKLVRDTEARAEGVVREARASQEAAEARAAREATRAEAAEEEARATRARLDACLHRHSHVAAMRDASASRARSRLMRRRAFEAWRFFFATSASARARGDAESAGDALASARRGLARAERSVRAALAFADVRARLSLLFSTGAFAFGAWRRANRASKRAAAIAEARADERLRAARREIAEAYRAARADAARSAAFREWRRVSAEDVARREALEREQWARRQAAAREEFRALARATAWCAKRRRRNATRLWRAAARARAAADGERVEAVRRRAWALTTQHAMASWRAFVVSTHERREQAVLVCSVVSKKRRAFAAWRARAEAHAALRERAARAAAARSARTCMARLAASEALAATRPLLFLERAFGARYAGSRNRRARDLWSRVLEGRQDKNRDAKTETRGRRMTDPNPMTRNRVDARLDARDGVGVARRRARLFAARAAHAFAYWSDLSRNESFRRSIAIEKHRVRRPLRSCFSAWRVRVASEKRRIAAACAARRAFAARRALAAWWLLAAETAEAGASAGACSETPETPRRDRGSTPGDPSDDAAAAWRRALSGLRWETPRGRPAAHWLGAALSAAARLASSSLDLEPHEPLKKPPKSVVSVVCPREDEKKDKKLLSSALARRVVVAGERLNRERDARRASLDAFRGILERERGDDVTYRYVSRHHRNENENENENERVYTEKLTCIFSTARPRLAWTRARGAEEEALRATRDVLVALGDFFLRNRGPVVADDARREPEGRARCARGGHARSRARTLPRIPRRLPASRAE